MRPDAVSVRAGGRVAGRVVLFGRGMRAGRCQSALREGLLNDLLGRVLRDDVRNGICHADYILWGDGLRLRRRNGGFATRIE